MADKIRVTVWNEYRHERNLEGDPGKQYPNGMHAVIAEYLNNLPDVTAKTAVLDDPEHGLTEEVLDNTDVLIWWGHVAHGEVQDEIVERVHQRVLNGLGVVFLHSAHFSKLFKKLMGTTCDLKWREAGEKERLYVIDHAHPITQGLPEYFELAEEEMYGERFDIPQPDEQIFISWFEGGEVFRSGCCWHRSRGRIFYFRPGHETYPTYRDANVMKVIENGVRWAKALPTTVPTYGFREPLEKLSK